MSYFFPPLVFAPVINKPIPYSIHSQCYPLILESSLFNNYKLHSHSLPLTFSILSFTTHNFHCSHTSLLVIDQLPDLSSARFIFCQINVLLLRTWEGSFAYKFCIRAWLHQPCIWLGCFSMFPTEKSFQKSFSSTTHKTKLLFHFIWNYFYIEINTLSECYGFLK